MAIEIIKNTLIDPIEMLCNECGSVFTFNYEDIKISTSQDFFGHEHRFRYVECPVCKYQCKPDFEKKEEKKYD